MARQNYKNGYYVGDLNSDGKRHGSGTYFWNEGSRYEGDWYINDMHGYGTYYYVDGSKYVGEFCHNVRDGFGVLTYPDGTRYEGEFVNDKRTGKGNYLYDNGDKYVGDFVNGDFHGKGIYYWSSGAWYEGDWANDERNGMGTYHHVDGSWLYGEYKDSRLVRTVRNSNMLTNAAGQRRKVCIEDIRDGVCSSDDNNGNNDACEQTGEAKTNGNIRKVKYSNGVYVGELDNNGDPSGYGVFTFESGASYKGYFLRGKRNGIGIYTYSDGDCYEGFFVDGDFHGYGVYRWKNGNRYEGEYRNDKPHGYGVVYFADGSWRFVHHDKGEVDKTCLDSDDIAAAVNAPDSGEISFTMGKYRGGITKIVKKSGLFGMKKTQELVAHGLGVFVENDGHKYEGNYANDDHHGYGKFTTPDGSQIYGYLVGDRYEGTVCAVSDLGTYVGQLDEDGKFVGDGSFYYKDCWYEGSFQNGNREGNGTMHFADGRIVVGEFAKDEMTRKVSEK